MARKGARPAPDEVDGDCIFTIEYSSAGHKRTPKRRRHGSEDSTASSPKMQLQASPFAPVGKFHKHPGNNMDRHFKVVPTDEWYSMTRYSSFVLNTTKYITEAFIFVANDSTAYSPPNINKSLQPRQKSDGDWVARILEIRARDENHVYARVYWMYSPDELPERTLYKGKRVAGRQPYHGSHELVASNHMDVINVISVTGPAIVNQWNEQKDEVQKALYWRQAINLRTMELSSVAEHCICRHPENPDKILIRCSNDKCGIWLHNECVVHNALEETWNRLGVTKPHQSMTFKQKLKDGDMKRSSSSDGTSASSTPLRIPDVKPERRPRRLAVTDFDAAHAFDGILRASPESILSVPKPKEQGQMKKAEYPELNKRTYHGSFRAVVIDDPKSAPTVQLTDLRSNILGGESVWREPIHCLRCHQVIQ